MENGKDSRVLLILNPVAGHKAARVLLYPLVKLVCANEGMATVYATSARGEAERIAREQGGQYDRILCCGGDGTLNEVLTGLVRAGVTVPVGYVPTGTTNDLAHALNLPTRLKAAMNLAVTGRPRGHDVGLINGDVMFDYVASFGAFADTAYSTPQRLKNALGRAAYFLCGRIRDVLQFPKHEGGYDQRALDKTRAAQIENAPVDDDAGVEHLGAAAPRRLVRIGLLLQFFHPGKVQLAPAAKADRRAQIPQDQVNHGADDGQEPGIPSAHQHGRDQEGHQRPQQQPRAAKERIDHRQPGKPALKPLELTAHRRGAGNGKKIK